MDRQAVKQIKNESEEAMELYIIRHGDPYYPTDSLTEKGVWEAKLLAERMKSINPDCIFSSPLGRAKQTASYTCEVLNKPCEIEDWTAESMDYMRYLDHSSEERLEKSYSFSFEKGVFDFEDFAKEERTKFITDMESSSDGFLSRFGYKREGGRYKIEAESKARIAVFCHGGFGGAWCARLLSMPSGMGWVVLSLDTTSVSKFVFNDCGNGYCVPRCSYLNDRSHIPEVR